MSGQAPLPPRHSSSVVSKGSKVPRATASNVRKPNPVPKAPNPTRPISRAAAIAAAATAQSSNTVGTAPSNRPTRIPAPTTAATLLGINPYIPSLTPPPTPHKAKTWAANTNPRTLRRTLHHNPNHPGTPSKDTVKYTDFPRWSRPATPVPPAPGSENELPSRSTTPILILPPVSPEIVAAPNSPLLSSSVGSSAPSTPCPRHTQKNRSLFHSRRRAFAPHDGVQEYYMSAFKEPPNDLDEIAKSPIFSGGFLIFFRFVFITLATTLGILHLVHQVYTGGVIFWGLLSISGIQVLWGIVASWWVWSRSVRGRLELCPAPIKLTHSRFLTGFYALATTLPITLTVLLVCTDLIFPKPGINWSESATILPHLLSYGGFIGALEVVGMSWFGGKRSVWILGSLSALVVALAGGGGLRWQVLTGVWVVVGVVSVCKQSLGRRIKERKEKRMKERIREEGLVRMGV